ncbi:diacylglycerol kinase [Piscinibacter sp.]|uniref:diacylglycerol kinase n=1 Tax=Piscinibacter sp. TaxID=1903157 RepID=UPI0039E6BD4D
MEHKNLSFRQRLGFAMNGIRAAYRTEKSLRVQAVAALLLLPFLAATRPSALWCAVLVAMAAFVVCLELVNTAVESVLDKLHPGKDEAIGFAKDCLAGAVLVASLASVLVFLLYVFAELF